MLYRWWLQGMLLYGDRIYNNMARLFATNAVVDYYTPTFIVIWIGTS